MAGWLGITALNALQIASQYLLLLVIPIFGISQAISILSSHLIGANQSNLLGTFGASALRLGYLFSCIALGIFILFPTSLISVFINIKDIHNSADLIQLISELLIIVVVGQFFDLLRNICSGSLRSMNITVQPMVISMAYIWLLSIPLAYILGFNFKFGLIGIFIAYDIGMMFAGISLYILWLKKVSFIKNVHKNISHSSQVSVLT